MTTSSLGGFTMDKKTALQAIKELRKNEPKKFTQSVELIVNLKEINLKNPDEQVEFFTQAPHQIKPKKICAIVAGELEAESQKVMDKTITQSELEKLKGDKKAVKKLAEEYDYFIAQANIMGQIAGVVGRVFGPRGKMPNPKAGCVVPPKGALQPLYDRLQSTVRIIAKKVPMIQLSIGNESMSDDVLAENIAYFYDQIQHHLPREKHNIKNAYVKLTMSKPVRLQ